MIGCCPLLGGGVVCYGLASGSPRALLVGTALFVLISSLLLTRARLERHRNQPELLRQNLAKLEHERDALLAANERYRNDNIVLRAMDVAFRDILNLADERSHGQMRILCEQIGDQLAEWLTEQMDSGCRYESETGLRDSNGTR